MQQLAEALRRRVLREIGDGDRRDDPLAAPALLIAGRTRDHDVGELDARNIETESSVSVCPAATWTVSVAETIADRYTRPELAARTAGTRYTPSGFVVTTIAVPGTTTRASASGWSESRWVTVRLCSRHHPALRAAGAESEVNSNAVQTTRNTWSLSFPHLLDGVKQQDTDRTTRRRRTTGGTLPAVASSAFSPSLAAGPRKAIDRRAIRYFLKERRLRR